MIILIIVDKSPQSNIRRRRFYLMPQSKETDEDVEMCSHHWWT